MKKSELKELIREIVLRKLNEADMNASISSDEKGNVQMNASADKKDDTKSIPPADQEKLNQLKAKQEELARKKREIDGKVKQREQPILKLKQDSQRKLAKIEPQLGKLAAEEEKLRRKYNK